MSRKSDVCLILEGTYPYIHGGVSSWVHQLICALKDIRFSLMIILPNREYIKEMKYKIPENVVDIRQVFIHDHEIEAKKYKKPNKNAAYSELEEFIINAANGDIDKFDGIYHYLLKENNTINLYDLLFSKYGWNLITNIYKHFKLNISFIDYFWTYRFTVLPLVQVMQAQVPESAIYHCISTGYAGLLGAVAKLRRNGALLLTEHGIYTKERKIEIAQASWIYDEKTKEARPQKTMSFFKQWWITTFSLMAKICYRHCSEIITLFEENQKLQIACGAMPSKLSIIPNGIDLKGFSPMVRTIQSNRTKFIIGFVGRVVPIKDVKTFIKACKIVTQYLPDIEILIMGPTDEEETYYHECVLLRDMLDLKDKMTFTGPVNVKEYYKKIDLIVLTSESEAQPLVILEANAMGVPVVASDVGACRELLNGRLPSDKALGASGLVTGVGSPDETAKAIMEILGSPDKYNAMSISGIKRVTELYNQNDLFAKYLNLYEKYLY